MSLSRPLIGIQADVLTIGAASFHGAGEKYINAVAHGAGATPLLIPGFGEGAELRALAEVVDIDELLGQLDGLFLPGSPSNVEPHRYGGAPSRPGTLHDPSRDAASLELIRAALRLGVPLLCVCRGYQELNVALGGSLHQHVHEQPGLLDHREDKAAPRTEQYAPVHPVRLSPGGLLAGLAGGAAEWTVNSLHGQGIERLAPGLAVEAVAPDGLVEAVRVAGATGFAVGVQWHPEWRFEADALSRALFAAFGDAARVRRAQRNAVAR
ncbi:gamma-glutamyl-gamma-aminobutyrate hydrolase [Plasticicumulans lactativorans]|uniref:gamma-glutamyl-gamma-aminobutyrate hydrolase n=1 Tax=Plasticicumulans lactativorans TaxID=1133106 RepID=A0A4R2LJR7_9GAMM|nr:gamma-glutamyl-gamma-aminobutyrate hydrolase family protein [Plasticicumulans lactativorans]TCO83476.1 gamma-glutamyl-gamma-aminobutyrate hydrolase [Plasticicumulans lactativorans]